MSTVKHGEDQINPDRSVDATRNPNVHSVNETLIASWTRRLGIYTGVLAVATVALVVATGIGTFFLWRSDVAIEGQLKEMRDQTATTRAQVRANMAQEDFVHEPVTENGIVTGWDISPRWKNSGATDASDLKGWWTLKFVAAFNRPPKSWTGADCPKFETPFNFEGASTVVIPSGHPWTLVSTRLSSEVVTQVLNGKGAVFAFGHLQYRDIFPDNPIHYFNWCDLVSPYDAPHNGFSFLVLYQASQ